MKTDVDTRRQWLEGCSLALLAAGMALVAYRAAWGGAFQLDDTYRIMDNPGVHMRELSWDKLVEAAQSYESRPIPMVTLALDWWRGEGEPQAFFATNVFVHATNAVLVFALFSLLLARWRPATESRDRRLAACAAATLWAVHPLASQAVVYIVQRMTSMAATGVLLAVIGYILFRTRGGRPRWMGLGVGVLGGAFGWWSKENAWILPLLLVLVEYGVVRSPPRWQGASWLDRAVYVALGVGAVGIVIDLASGAGPVFRRFNGGYDTRTFSMVERLLTQSRVIFFHLGQLLYPTPSRLSIEHDIELSTSLLSPPTTVLAVMAIILWGVAGVAGLFGRRTRPWAFLALWPLVTLSVESSIVPLELIFEHRMYLPMVTLVGLPAMAILSWSGRIRAKRPRVIVLVVSVVLALVLQLMTHQRVRMWNDPVAFWSNAMIHAPNSARPRVFLATAYMTRQDYARAERLLIEAINLDQYYVFAYTNLGIIYTSTDRMQLAVVALERGLELDPDRAETNGNLGFTYLRLGRIDDAIRHLERAAAGKPWDAPVHLNLGIAYKKKGWVDRAETQFRKARELKEQVFDLSKSH